jgi:hypothetical protein
MTQVLGLPLDQALASLSGRGIFEVRIERIEPEKHPEGTLRVIRARPGVLTVARFPDRVRK